MIIKPKTKLGRLLIVLLVVLAVVFVVKNNKSLKYRLAKEQTIVTRIIYRETSTLVRFVNNKDTVSKTVMVAKRLRNGIKGVLSDKNIKNVYKTIKR